MESEVGMKIAVVGAGLFGCTAAIYAARAGHDVHLFEKKSDILQCASGINQFRLHRGYHYPRSARTVHECQEGLESFKAEYGPAVIDGERHLYAIAEDSRVSASQYKWFCDDSNLPYKVLRKNGLVSDEIEMLIEADESRISPVILSRIIKERLLNNRVNVHLGVSEILRRDYDMVVVAAYAGTNSVLEMLGCDPETYQFEVCEKPVVKMPKGFPSIVVMDGEFCCVDPYEDGLYLLGHVKHAIHHSNVGTHPERLDYLPLDCGIGTPIDTRFDEFIASGMNYIPALEHAEYVGSMFTVRAVLADKDDTDERPTLVHQLDDNVIRIFSGKLGTAASSAQEVTDILDKQGGRRQSAA